MLELDGPENRIRRFVIRDRALYRCSRIYHPVDRVVVFFSLVSEENLACVIPADRSHQADRRDRVRRRDANPEETPSNFVSVTNARSAITAVVRVFAWQSINDLTNPPLDVSSSRSAKCRMRSPIVHDEKAIGFI